MHSLTKPQDTPIITLAPCERPRTESPPLGARALPRWSDGAPRVLSSASFWQNAVLLTAEPLHALALPCYICRQNYAFQKPAALSE